MRDGKVIEDAPIGERTLAPEASAPELRTARMEVKP
jgi:hypothetical protein